MVFVQGVKRVEEQDTLLMTASVCIACIACISCISCIASTAAATRQHSRIRGSLGHSPTHNKL